MTTRSGVASWAWVPFLAVGAVITALYPASTVLLARFALSERIHRVQLGGLGVAAAAVVLLARS